MRYFDYITDEFRTILKDEGVLLFFVFLPIAYPLMYSWVYNNEVVREVPVAVVDASRSALSREFIRKYDASPDVSVAMYCQSIEEAKDRIGHGEAYGLLYFPGDFDLRVGRMERGHVSVYCDMSYMLTYKAIYQTAVNVSGMMGSELQRKMSGKYTAREEEISVKPLDYEEVPIFNPTGGYAGFILPGVLVLIIQQAMLLGVGMLAGTRREKALTEGVERRNVSMLFGRATAYSLIFAVMLAWTTLIVPRLFGIVSMVRGWDLLQFLLPYLLASAFFSIAVGEMVRYRESVMLIVVFTSVPLLFLSGVSWPLSNMPAFWQGVSWTFPSTFAVRGFVRMSSMGASVGDCQQEYVALWVQSIVYMIITVGVYARNKKYS